MSRSFFALAVCLFCLTTVAQEPTYDFTYTQPSAAFHKDRTFYVHVPELYYETEEAFGVIYVLDAQAASFYHQAKSIVDYLVWSSHLFPVIVVGIHSDNRGTEFIPKDRSLPPDDENNNGQAEVLQGHLQYEVFPFIKENFRINEFRALIGHSRGGAFVAHTLFGEQKDLFNAYIAVSPAMHYLNNQILNDAKERITQQQPFHKFFFGTHGTIGSNERFFGPQVQYLDSLLTQHPNPTLHWHTRQIDDVSHWGVVAPSIDFGLLEMNRAYQVDEFLIEQFAANTQQSLSQQIQAYEAQQTQKLGYFVPLSARSLRRYAGSLGEEEQYNSALELYNLALVKDSHDIRSYFGKAWVLEELGNPNQSIATYEAAKAMLDAKKHALSQEDTEKWLGRIAKELERLKG